MEGKKLGRQHFGFRVLVQTSMNPGRGGISVRPREYALPQHLYDP